MCQCFMVELSFWLQSGGRCIKGQVVKPKKGTLQSRISGRRTYEAHLLT